MWHDSFTHVTWLVQSAYDMGHGPYTLVICDMMHVYLWYVTWLIHACDMTRPKRLWYVTWFIYTCDIWYHTCTFIICDMTHIQRYVTWIMTRIKCHKSWPIQRFVSRIMTSYKVSRMTNLSHEWRIFVTNDSSSVLNYSLRQHITHCESYKVSRTTATNHDSCKVSRMTYSKMSRKTHSKVSQTTHSKNE